MAGFKHSLKFICALVVTLYLVACGSGGGTEGTAPFGEREAEIQVSIADADGVPIVGAEVSDSNGSLGSTDSHGKLTFQTIVIGDELPLEVLSGGVSYSLLVQLGSAEAEAFDVRLRLDGGILSVAQVNQIRAQPLMENDWPHQELGASSAPGMHHKKTGEKKGNVFVADGSLNVEQQGKQEDVEKLIPDKEDSKSVQISSEGEGETEMATSQSPSLESAPTESATQGESEAVATLNSESGEGENPVESGATSGGKPGKH